MEYKETYGDMEPKVLKAVDITKPNKEGYVEYGIRDLLYTVKLTKQQMKDPMRTIDYWFTDHHRCGHDYDCCGCWRWTAYRHTIRHTKRREFTFMFSGRANI